MVKRNHKTKELSQLQTVKKENDKLKKEVGRLRKQLRKHIEVEYIEEDNNDVEVEVPKQAKMNSCPKCQKGSIEELEIGIHTLKVCNLCTYRKVKLGDINGK